MGTSQSFDEAAVKTERWASDLLGPNARRVLTKAAREVREIHASEIDRVMPLEGFGRGEWRGRVTEAKVRTTPVGAGTFTATRGSGMLGATFTTEAPGILVRPTGKGSAGVWGFLEYGSRTNRWKNPKRPGSHRKPGGYSHPPVKARRTWSAARNRARLAAVWVFRVEMIRTTRKAFR